jgi:hypothetical protein
MECDILQYPGAATPPREAQEVEAQLDLSERRLKLSEECRNSLAKALEQARRRLDLSPLTALVEWTIAEYRTSQLHLPLDKTTQRRLTEAIASQLAAALATIQGGGR